MQDVSQNECVITKAPMSDICENLSFDALGYFEIYSGHDHEDGPVMIKPRPGKQLKFSLDDYLERDLPEPIEGEEAQF